MESRSNGSTASWASPGIIVRILIIDDEPRRYERLFESLGSIGIARSNIDLVMSTEDARERISAHQYDLLVLDILVPVRPESECSAQNAIDLLFEINERELPNSPRYVLGITADRSISPEAADQFEKWCWVVLDYSSSSDEWISRATNCAQFIRGRGDLENHSVTEVDIAIVCALAEPELSEVLKLPWKWKAQRPIDDVTFVHDGTIELEGQTYSVCATATSRMGMVATALRSATLIQRLRPKLLVMTGICAGVRGKVGIGDVILADPAWDFQSGKQSLGAEGPKFLFRPHHIPAPTIVRAHLEQLRADRATLATISGSFDTTPPNVSKVVIGPMASGSSVLADGKTVQQIREQHQELVGIEMEAYGLYAAAQLASSPRPLAFALKGVCDFADEQKEDGHQRYAAFASARVLQHIIETAGMRLIQSARAGN